MSLVYVGEQDFVKQPGLEYSKNEFGVDIMTVKYSGPAFALASFLETLEQGATSSDDDRFYLQTWTVDDHRTYPTVTMVHKGLLNGIPEEMASDDTSMQSLTVSTATPSNASREMQFWATQTSYRYVTDERPIGPTYSETSTGIDPVIFSSVIRDENGSIYYGTAPADLVTALTPAIIDLVTGYSATPIYGTPFFECIDNVIRTYQTQ